MQTSKITHQINEVAIQQRMNDGYLNGTAMCVANGKDIADWLKTEPTLELVTALALDLGITSNSASKPNSIKTRVSATYPQLVVVKRGSPKNGGGTWLHPDLAIQLAQWCSPTFALQVSRWVFDWLTKGGNPIWQENRALLKQSNSKLMDAVKAYIDRHPELSDNAKKWAFINVNDRLCKILTGDRVSKLCRDKQIETWRDAIDADLAKSLELLETLTIRLIDRTDLLPLDAVKEAASRLLLVDV